MFDSISRLRHFTLGALLCAAATVTACAHSQQSPPADSASPNGQGSRQGSRMRHGGGSHGDRMFEGMNLTTDQRAQIKLVRDRYRLKADSLRAGGADRDSTTRSAIHSMMQQEMAEIRNLLTPDQQKQFDDKMAKMRNRHHEHGDKDGHDGPPAPADNSGGAPPPPPPG
jgi:Spy/CpxP family protein refolding chaperone